MLKTLLKEEKKINFAGKKKTIISINFLLKNNTKNIFPANDNSTKTRRVQEEDARSKKNLESFL